MATTERKLYAREVAAYNDTELDRLLKDIRDSGTFCLDIEDPQNLPQAFYQRLRERWLRAADTVDAKTRSLDLDQVNARLLEKFHNRLSPSISSAESGDEEEEYKEDLRYEKESYDMLVNDGCRPWYSIDYFDDVTKNPEVHPDKLWLWRSYDDQWKVFGPQLVRWQNFRKYQRYAREHKVENERTLRIAAQNYTAWEEFTERCPFYLNDPGREQFGFPEYSKALKDRLSRHGFTRKFQLDDDPRRQDKLTTWIEYIGYEYGEYDRCVNLMKRLRRQYEAAWKMLVDSDILRPFETEEHIVDITSAFQRQNEEIQAEEFVKSALSAMSVQQVIPNSSGSLQSLATARSELARAIQNPKFTKRRNDIISKFKQDTKEYRAAKHEKDRYETLLRWMLEQVPLIDLDINQSKAIEEADCRDERKKLKRASADELSEEHPKRQKTYNSLQSTIPASKASASQGQKRSKRTHPNHTNGEISSELEDEPCSYATAARGESPKILRRSSRIRQQTRLDSHKNPRNSYGSNKVRKTRNKQHDISDRQIVAHQATHSSRRCKVKRQLDGHQNSSGNSNERSILLHNRRQRNQSQLVNPPRRSERLRKRAIRRCEG